ncbi:MAG: PfkB family carbohydrate kinase [Spirochaetaceae bacterium]|jgi:fructokinase|nr:PfkB family carbohydrate kinase [Spirochaetaceae bacterium]
MVDLFAEAPGGFYERFDLTGPVQHVSSARAGEILRDLEELQEKEPPPVPPPVYRAGGGAATAAKIAAGLGIGAAFAGALGGSSQGADPLGRLFERDLTRRGTALHLVYGKDPTGVCITLTIGKDRRIAASPGAALEFSAGDIPEKQARGAKLLLLDGYMLDRAELVRRFFELAPAAALDAGSASIIRAQAGKLIAYFKSRPFLLFVNEEEAAALYCALAGGGAFPKAAALEDFLRELCGGAPGSCIVLKQGERGARVFRGKTVFRAKTQALEPEHTAGAGDAFAGGFLAGFLQNKTPEECAALGNRTAGEFLAPPGPAGSPEFTEFRGFAKSS